MLRRCRTYLRLFALLARVSALPCSAQQEDTATAQLKEVRANGFRTLSEPKVISLTGLEAGSFVGKKELQAGADRLVQTGLFSKVSYNFQTRATGVFATYHVEESPRIPVYFDNIPWFSDSELLDVIRKKLSFFDGSLPEGGGILDQAGDALKELLSARGLQVSLEHLVIANPLGEGNVQEYRIEGASLQIAALEFGDPGLADSKIVRQHLAEIEGKPYSRIAIELFLSEAIKPIYLQQGYLRVKLGPPEIHLTGNPNQKLPGQLPVFVPVESGPVYHWRDLRWTGNTLLSEFALNGLLAIKSGDVADGMKIEAGWDRVREEYGHRGYLESKLDLTATYDDQAHTISYEVSVREGTQFHFGKMVLTGLSPAGERKLHAAWPIASGEIFDKAQFEEILTKLQSHQEQIFGELPLHYETVGHWLQTDPASASVDVLLDFK
ncbi:MAG TPA: POTRA domain-containing protein [Candidatus Acidoferrum sp.]|nr:POTRA domain-containing protein [Candidatus Acidoferrum sp.]